MKLDKTLSAHIMRIANKLIFIEKRSIFEFQNIKLYPSEIHLMQVIEADHNLNSTQIAKRLGVTKGAVSQTLSRLERKGIILKYRRTVNFTKLGQAVMKSHHYRTRAVQNEYESYVSTLSEKDKEVILRFLRGFESFIDQRATEPLPYFVSLLS